jgi:glucosamine--fructose-6-phosphate aminotransferase (isomerizing)
MCGIVGYLGSRPPVPLIVESLRRLEYRGYDSAGVAYLDLDDGNLLRVYKASGKLLNLERVLPAALSLNGNGRIIGDQGRSHPDSHATAHVGIGHIRWATHGAANDVNAHPHTGNRQEIALVHNGIIENFYELRQELQAQGQVFHTDTDTESVVHLLETLAQGEPDFGHVVLKALARLKGAYALTVISRRYPDRLYAARNQAPLVIGVGEDGTGRPEYIVASDAVAIVPHTNRLIYLKDGEIAEIGPDGVRITRLDGTRVEPVIETVSADPLTIDKKGYKHFMLKEIHEQPDVVRHSLSGRLQSVHLPVNIGFSSGFSRQQSEEAEGDAFERVLDRLGRVVIIGCGTSYNAGLVGQYFIEDLARLPVSVESAGEFRYRNPCIQPGDLVITLSQSGETADTLAALRLSREQGASVLALTNREDSTMAREADFVLPVRAGVEVSVAATKSFTAQVTALVLLGLALAERRGTADAETLETLKSGLLKIPAQIEATLQSAEEPLQALARKYGGVRDVLFIARGVNFPVSLEGALKLKEISYIHAEAYSGSELKHGPIAMLDAAIPVVAVLTRGSVFEKMISNCQEAKARDARVIAIANTPIPPELAATFEDIVVIPECPEPLSPLLTTIPLQMLAYYTAEFLGKDVDQPRNLAKSVTVE